MTPGTKPYLLNNLPDKIYRTAQVNEFHFHNSPYIRMLRKRNTDRTDHE